MDYLKINEKAWNKRTKTHVNSKFYDVDGFLKGQSSLNEVEINQVGNVNGKKLLHLQCHFGLDSLSWARLGATVTGLDLSSEAIDQAKKLSMKSKLDATFICDDVYQFGEKNTEKYDIVFSSYGVLCWLPDLSKWAETVSNSLKNGGEFHLVEFHSFNDLLTGFSYFPQSQPDIEEDGTYTENCDGQKSTMVTWSHSLSEVISSLINAGLTLEVFQEFAYSPYNCFDGLENVGEKTYQMLYKDQQVPLLYSIKARKY